MHTTSVTRRAKTRLHFTHRNQSDRKYLSLIVYCWICLSRSQTPHAAHPDLGGVRGPGAHTASHVPIYTHRNTRKTTYFANSILPTPLKSPIYLSKSESHAPWARRAHGAVPLCVPAPRALGPHQVGVWNTVVSDRQPRDIRFIVPSAVYCRFRSVTGWAFNTNTWTFGCLFH
jgi:hypothetical protein